MSLTYISFLTSILQLRCTHCTLICKQWSVGRDSTGDVLVNGEVVNPSRGTKC